MDYAKLTSKVAELTAAHPEWTDQQIADECNLASIAQIGSVTTKEFLDAITPQETAKIEKTAQDEAEEGFADATTLQEYWYAVGSVDMAPGTPGRARITGLVAAAVLSEASAAALVAAATDMVSWATSEGLEVIREGHVQQARAM